MSNNKDIITTDRLAQAMREGVLPIKQDLDSFKKEVSIVGGPVELSIGTNGEILATYYDGIDEGGGDE